jgi:integrase
VGSVKKRPDGKWRARYRDAEGREHARHFVRKVDAEQWVAQETADILRGTWVDPRAGKVTFKDYAEQWRTSQPHRPATETLYERLLRLHVYPTLGERSLSSVRRSDVQAMVKRLSTVVAPATVRQAYAVTRTVFRAAVEDKLINESPCRRVALPELPDDKIVPLSVEQVRRIIDVAPPSLRAVIVLAAATGLRSGELLGLTVDRVDFLRRQVEVDRQMVYIPGKPPSFGPPKTKASRRTVPVPQFALDELAMHLQQFPSGADGLVFQATQRGGPMLRTTLHARWVKVLDAAGLPRGTRFHELRHHYASVLIDGGESVKVVQERLGHASAVETLKTYAHLWPSSDERTRQVVERAWASSADSMRTGGEGQASHLGE